VLALAVSTVTAACGTVAASHATAPRPIRLARTARVSGPAHGPVAGTRAESVRLARRLLTRLVLPPGSRRLPGRPPASVRQSAGGIMAATSTIDVYRLYSLPLT
jgi:hypothetical protein